MQIVLEMGMIAAAVEMEEIVATQEMRVAKMIMGLAEMQKMQHLHQQQMVQHHPQIQTQEMVMEETLNNNMIYGCIIRKESMLPISSK